MHAQIFFARMAASRRAAGCVDDGVGSFELARFLRVYCLPSSCDANGCIAQVSPEHMGAPVASVGGAIAMVVSTVVAVFVSSGRAWIGTCSTGLFYSCPLVLPLYFDLAKRKKTQLNPSPPPSETRNHFVEERHIPLLTAGATLARKQQALLSTRRRQHVCLCVTADLSFGE